MRKVENSCIVLIISGFSSAENIKMEDLDVAIYLTDGYPVNNMYKKTTVDLKRSQLVVVEGSACDIRLDAEVDYYPLSSAAMIMKHGMASDKFRVDGILWSLWGDVDLSEKDCVDMQCCFDFHRDGTTCEEKSKMLFSILFFDGKHVDVNLSKEEFYFVLGVVREQHEKIKNLKEKFSPLEKKLPMKRMMDSDEINLILSERRSVIRKRGYKILAAEFLMLMASLLLIFFADESFMSSEQQSLSMFIAVFFYSLSMLSSAFSSEPIKDIESEFVRK